MSFCVLFVCKCVLYYCHWATTQLQLINISYHHIIHIYVNHVSLTLYVLSWKCGSYWAGQETAYSYSLSCSLNTLLVPDESNSNLHIQFHYSCMYKFIKFYMQQDRSKMICHSFYVCEVRQSCKHTVKSGEDKTGVL